MGLKGKNILKWKNVENKLQQNSPYDYETYIQKLYNYKENKYIRKVKAFKFAMSKMYSLHIYKKDRYVKASESQVFYRRNNLEYLDMLSNYDIVSFDMFDTLIIRDILNPTDVFHLIGMKLNINGFREIRCRAEREAIRQNNNTKNTDEITLDDIYFIINQWCGLDIKKGIETEIEIELAVCNANPYWSEIYHRLLDMGKKVIIITDMYIAKKEIKNILTNAGYNLNNVEVYVSNEYGVNKRNGELFKAVLNKTGKDKKYIHIGDNVNSDVKQPQKYQWDTIYYKDVHSIGRPYRNIKKSIIKDSICGGIVNSTLHNGKLCLTPLEEFGFNYYGRLLAGYCQWLNKLAKEENIDKFLFVARDGYLVRDIYGYYFNEIPHEYVYTSRFALSKINIGENMELFIQQNIVPKAYAHNCTIGEVLRRFQLQELMLNLKDDIGEGVILSRYNLESFIKYLYSCKNIIIESYSKSIKAAECYYKSLINGYKNICVVDVGWYGTSTIGIKDFVKKHMKWEGRVIGAQIGIECGVQNMELFLSGSIKSYVFSPDMNIDIYKKHDFEIGNVVDEIIFSAPEPSLKQYDLNEHGEVTFLFLNEPEENKRIVKEVQKGIKIFADRYYNLIRRLKLDLTIQGAEAYEPILQIVRNKNYILKLFGEYQVQRNASPDDMEWQKVMDLY